MALSQPRTALIYVAAWLGDGAKTEARGVYCLRTRWLVFSYLSKSRLVPTRCSRCRGGWEVASNVARPRLLEVYPSSDTSRRVGFVPNVTSSDKVAC